MSDSERSPGRGGSAVWVGIDTGGTFTDLVAVELERGRYHYHKVPTHDRRSRARHPRRHRGAARSEPARARRRGVPGARHDARDQRGAGGQVGAHRAASRPRVFATCSSSRASAARITSISTSRSRCRRPRATAASRSAERIAHDGAEVTPLAEDDVRARRRAPEAARRSRRSRSASCTPTPTRRTKNGARALVAAAVAGRLSLQLRATCCAEFREFERFATADGQREPDAGHGPLSRALRARRGGSRHHGRRRASCSRTAARCRPARCGGCRSTRSSRDRRAA